MTRIPDAATARAAYIAATDAREAAFAAYRENPNPATFTAHRDAFEAMREALRVHDLAQRAAAFSGGAA